MSIIEKVSRNMQMLNPQYNADNLGQDFQYYIETVCAYNGTKEDLLEILNLYGKEIINYIKENQEIIDAILQEDGIHRHDLDVNNEVDFKKVLKAIFDNQELTGFEAKAKDVILLEVMNFYNTYGMDFIKANKEQIKKEIEYGIYKMKTDPDRDMMPENEDTKEENAHSKRDYEEIMRLGDKYGKETLPYIENLELLQKRTNTLLNIIDPTLKSELVNLSSAIATIISAKNDPTSTLKIDVELLEKVFSTYDKLNKLTLKNNMVEEVPSIIDKPMGNLLMLHFIQDETENTHDKDMNEFLQEEIISTAKKIISESKGLPYNDKTDYKLLEAILNQYYNSRKNPIDLASRIPMRSQYIGKSGGFGFATVITKPTTLLSVSISAPENIKPHLNRKIAIGFLPKDIPIEAIASTSNKFNSEKDRITFDKGKYSIAEMMQYSNENSNTNETLVDWTQLKPGYILIVKDHEMIDLDVRKRAEELAQQNNLPIVIYDAYTIKRNRNSNTNENHTTTGKK